MKKAILVLILISLCLSAWAQCPTAFFTTQQQIDDFALNYPNCTEITNDMTITNSVADPITNLNGLSNILSVSGNLWLFVLPSLSGLENLSNVGGDLILNSNSFTTLAGLEGLVSVGGDLSMKDNEALTSLTGLENLATIDGNFYIGDNDALTSLSGVNSLNTVGGNLRVLFSHALNDLTGLESISTVNGNLHILVNNNLANLSGLENISSIGGNLDIRFNDALTSLSSLANFNSSVDSLWIRGNDALTTLDGLENITIENYLWIQENTNLSVCGVQSICTYIENGGTTDINTNATNCNSPAEVQAVCIPMIVCPSGDVTFYTQQQIDDFPTNYATCTTISGNVYIDGNGGSITSLDGLSQIENIEGNLIIENIDAITDLSAFENLTSIDGQLSILGCSSLANIDALENLNSVGSINIQNNSNLSDCSIEPICDHIAANGTTIIQNNSSGCNSAAQVTNICLGFANCPAGNVNFNTQQEIDDFPTNYPGCTTIFGDVYIYDSANGINNLDALSQIVNIEGSLIFESVNGITDLSGLENLNSIGGYLSIEYSSGLASLAGLENLNSIGGSLSFYYNNVLSDITSLSNLTSIGGDLYVEGNSLSSFAGLDNVASIGGDLELLFSYNLADISSLQALTAVGGDIIIDYTSLSNLNGLENLSSIGGDLELRSNDNLTNISGLQGLTSVGGDLEIISTYQLVSLTGLENLSSIGGKLKISSNDMLSDISALNNVTAIGGELEIRFNYVLDNLTGLDNIDHNTITNLIITSNDVLSYCGVASVCEYLDAGGTYTIDDNATGCNDSNSVLQVCFPSACPQADVVLSSQQEVDDFAVTYPGCTEIPGNLTINNTTDLSGLSQLTTIAGQLRFGNNNLSNLNGLQNINSIGTNVVFSNNTISSFSGFGVTSIEGDFLIGGNDIQSLSGMESLTTIGGELTIEENFLLIDLGGLNNLTSVGANLTLRNNKKLSDITALSSLNTINGRLRVSAHNMLTNLTGLENIDPTTINYLQINANPTLAVCSAENICTYLNGGGVRNIVGNAPGCNTPEEIIYDCSNIEVTCPTGDLTLNLQQEIDEFTNLTNCTSIPGRLIIRGLTTSSITNLDGLSQLTSIEGGLVIDANNALTSLNGLENLTTTGDDLIITNNNNLTSLEGLENVTSTASHLKIENNDALTNFTGLEGITSIGGNLSIIGNSSLQSISGLENLTNIGGELSIISHINLTDLAGLDNLTSIGTNIRLQNNRNISTLAALSNVNSVNGFIRVATHNTLTSLAGLENIDPNDIQDLILVINPNLSVCSVPNICTYLENGGVHTIYQNVMGCNTSTEILDNCSDTNLICPTGDITFTTQQEIDDFATIPNCAIIPGNLTIQPVTPGDITNLDGLSQITTIDGWLLIEGTSASDLNGLSNLTSVGNALVIKNNAVLTDLSALANLTTLPSSLSIDNNDALISLSGLENISQIGESLLIFDNAALQNLSGLEGVTAIGSQLYVQNNAGLTDFSGLENLISIGTDIRLQNNPSLNSLAALSNVNSIGGYIRVSGHSTLTSLDGLENIAPNNITDLILTNNPNLEICNQTNVCTYLENGGMANIANNTPGCDTQAEVQAACMPVTVCPDTFRPFSQEDIDNFPSDYPNCTEIQYLDIAFGSDITNLDSLAQLTSITGDIEITNTQLTSLWGLHNLTSLGDFLYIYGNLNLSVCSLPNICDYIESGQESSIFSNAPGCSSVEEIQLLCDSPCTGSTATDSLTHIFDQDLFIDGVGFANNPTVTFTDPGTPANTVLSDISLELYFRLNGNTCENEIAIQITDPAGNTQPLTAYTTCDGGTGLYYVNLNVPSGNTTGSVADWIIEFDDTNDQNADYEYSVRFARLNYVATTAGGSGETVVNEVSEIADMDLFIDGIGFDNNPSLTFPDPGTPADAVLSDISLELYFRLNGASCENEIAIQITNPAGNTQPLTAYMTCDGGTGLYYVNLDVPSGNTTGSVADWVVEFDDTNDQNADYEYSVRFGRLTYTTTYSDLVTPVIITDEVVRTADSDLFIDGVGFDNNPTYVFYDPATPATATLSDISLELYFRLNGASCENEIAIQITDPAGNTQPLTAYTSCDGGTGLYYVNLDVPSGNVTGSIAPWIVQFDDTDDQNADYEYSVRFGRLTYTTQYDLCDTEMMIVEENNEHQLNTPSTQQRVNHNTTTPQHHNTIKLYPVPASQHLNVEYFSENTNSTNIEVLSNDGKTLLQKEEFSQEGINTIRLDIADLPAGHYHIRMYNADDMQMQSFVKIAP